MSDAFDEAIEKLLADESPRDQTARLDADEQQMVQMAQLLRGSSRAAPHDEFVQELRDRLTQPGRVSRRTAVIGTVAGMAAGIIAGLGLDHIPGSSRHGQDALVGADGRWVAVAAAAEVPDGAIRPFTAGPLQGFLIHRHGQIRALSRICTHMGCRLNVSVPERAFVCPCHGAEFELTGESRYGPGGYTAPLPPLPPIKVRVRDGSIEVWTV